MGTSLVRRGRLKKDLRLAENFGSLAMRQPTILGSCAQAAAPSLSKAGSHGAGTSTLVSLMNECRSSRPDGTSTVAIAAPSHADGLYQRALASVWRACS